MRVRVHPAILASGTSDSKSGSATREVVVVIDAPRGGQQRVAKSHAVFARYNIPLAVCSAAFAALFCGASAARAQATVDVGVTGFGVKRPVLASACPNGCPWGELGDFVSEALLPFGYEVIQCRNCNRALGPPLVARASLPPELGIEDLAVGTTTRVNAKVDFGITSSSRLAWAYTGRYTYAQDGPFANLRLIAKIEDPSYLLCAVKAESGITDHFAVASSDASFVAI